MITQTSRGAMESRHYDDACCCTSTTSTTSTSKRMGTTRGTRTTSSGEFTTTTAAASMLLMLLLTEMLLVFPLASCSRVIVPVKDVVRNPPGAEAQKLTQMRHLQNQERVDYKTKPYPKMSDNDKSRRDLRSGLGSSPPQCNSKCGRCTPCKPVHVPIQPGLIRTTEYYPEAWRCKCGNKLYMP